MGGLGSVSMFNWISFQLNCFIEGLSSVLGFDSWLAELVVLVGDSSPALGMNEVLHGALYRATFLPTLEPKDWRPS